ncbi:hypothetical protein [Methylobacterium oxalidis]|uniref:Uncharacterized protein n=1 Tax=Methylobacterium oxalidis TaxID=944322 RepID=A0A512JCJ4_9HYPH|nr:hypothetical protein [Methylobacterium oxalidis]GEP07694.1 hypothetical protein MOX02_57320 [Methylobacterium oxalidis]GJE35712.1 hypothetical protein LDDCCGHA_5932 [Methylobacterium oxalidis]GLS64858.1 hypothetical protein GCM10007888_32390 [Methylobacterium oxalidis]
MSTADIIVLAVRGDNDALEKIRKLHPPTAGIIERTRARLAGMGERLAEELAANDDPDECERLIRIELEKALIEMVPRPERPN